MCRIMAESLLSQNPRLIFVDDNSKIDLLIRQVKNRLPPRGGGAVFVFFTIEDMGLSASDSWAGLGMINK